MKKDWIETLNVLLYIVLFIPVVLLEVVHAGSGWLLKRCHAVMHKTGAYVR